jgi:ubiquinone/menaquinone biosynthesis C-methylase UbiE
MNPVRLCGVLLLLMMAGAAGLVVPAGTALAQGADPAINVPFADPEFEEWVRRFERPGREVYDQRHEIIAATGVEAGMAVADIGAGTGLHTWLFAERVGPDGHVYAIDISPVFIENIRRIAEAKGLGNVSAILNTQDDVRLPPASVDLAFLSNVYHHFEQPQPIMASIHRALRPGGTLVVIDFERGEGAPQWVRHHARIGREQALEEISGFGFELLEDADFLQQNYFLRFRKVDARADSAGGGLAEATHHGEHGEHGENTRRKLGSSPHAPRVPRG